MEVGFKCDSALPSMKDPEGRGVETLVKVLGNDLCVKSGGLCATC